MSDIDDGNTLARRVFWNLVYWAIRLWNGFSAISPLVLLGLMAGSIFFPSFWWWVVAIAVTVSWAINIFWNR